jgi:hypothetical protein
MRRFKNQTADPALTLQQAAIQLAAKKYKKKAPVPPKRMSSFKEHFDVHEDGDPGDDAEMSASMTDSVVWGQPVNNRSLSTSEELLSTGSRSRSESLDKLLDRSDELILESVVASGSSVDTQSLPPPPPSLLVGLDSDKLDPTSFPLLHLRSSLRKMNSPTPARATVDADPSVEDKNNALLVTADASETSSVQRVLGRFSTVPKSSNANEKGSKILDNQKQPENGHSADDSLLLHAPRPTSVGRSVSAQAPATGAEKIADGTLPRQKSDVPPRASAGRASPMDPNVIRLPTIGVVDSTAADRKKNLAGLGGSLLGKQPDSGIGSLSADLEASSKLFRDRMQLVHNASTSSEELLDGGRSLDSSGDSLDFDRVVDHSDKDKIRTANSADSSPALSASGGVKSKAKLLAEEVSLKAPSSPSSGNTKTLGNSSAKPSNEATKPASLVSQKLDNKKVLGDKQNDAQNEPSSKTSKEKQADANSKQDSKSKGSSNPFKLFSSKTSTSSSSSKADKSPSGPALPITAGDSGNLSPTSTSSGVESSASKPALVGARPILPGSKPVLPAQLSTRTNLHRVETTAGGRTTEDGPVTKEALVRLSDDLRVQLDALLSGSSKHYSVFMQLSEHASNFCNACASYVDSLPPHGKFQFRELLTSLQTVADGLKTCNASAYEKKVAELRSLVADISTAVKR